MLIGELAKNSGLSRDTIRWYEKIGLLKAAETSRNANNYRSYDAKALERLILIRQSKSFGFSLAEIREVLALTDFGNLSCDTVAPIIQSKLDAIDKQILTLQKYYSKLVTLREQCPGDCQNQILESTDKE